jgi:uncharacterized membrane protein
MAKPPHFFEMNAMDCCTEKQAWRTAALLASILMNALLLSYVGGQMAGGSAAGVFRLNPEDRIEMLAKRLPEADADLLRKAYRARGADFANVNSNHEEAVSRVLALMAQPQLDLGALRTELLKARGHRERLNDLLSEILLATIQKMPASSRAAFANGF